MIEAATCSAEQTRELARGVAGLVENGDVVVLAGDLGAGKTAFVQGFGAALGVVDRITSPTFTLAHRYQGRLTVHHLDVYRLEHLDQVVDLDLPELLDGDDVCVIEWGDAISPALAGDYLEIRLTFGEGDDHRTIRLRPVGPHWLARERALAEALEPWAA